MGRKKAKGASRDFLSIRITAKEKEELEVLMRLEGDTESISALVRKCIWLRKQWYEDQGKWPKEDPEQFSSSKPIQDPIQESSQDPSEDPKQRKLRILRDIASSCS